MSEIIVTPRTWGSAKYETLNTQIEFNYDAEDYIGTPGEVGLLARLHVALQEGHLLNDPEIRTYSTTEALMIATEYESK